jgi:hypothetical protein
MEEVKGEIAESDRREGGRGGGEDETLIFKSKYGSWAQSRRTKSSKHETLETADSGPQTVAWSGGIGLDGGGGGRKTGFRSSPH